MIFRSELGRPEPPASPSGPQPGGSTSVLEQTETQQEKAPGDNERYAHFVRRDRVTASAVTGQPVVALCGKVWIPLRDPKNFPICPACKSIKDGMDNQGANWPFSGGSNGSDGE